MGAIEMKSDLFDVVEDGEHNSGGFAEVSKYSLAKQEAYLFSQQYHSANTLNLPRTDFGGCDTSQLYCQ